MIERSLGYQYLIDKYELAVCELFVRLYLSTESQKKVVKKDLKLSQIILREIWGRKKIFGVGDYWVKTDFPLYGKSIFIL